MPAIKTLKQLRILMTTYTNCCGSDLSLIILVMGYAITTGAAGSIRFFRVVRTMDYIAVCNGYNAIYIMFGVIHFVGMVPKNTKKVIEMEKAATRPNSVSSRKIRSVAIIGIRAGPIRVMKHNAIHICFTFIINNIVALLVLFPPFDRK